ncbi:hypothetical protein GGR51DRAFT_555170 [Nemania sp. FL0031]|nr:hypothetical protein GGR51DRAFT_555170 [Nemania sp. FL0031]
MAKADSKVEAQAFPQRKSESLRTKQFNPRPKTSGESIRCTRSSKNTSSVKRDAVQSAPTHTKRALEATSEISRPPAKRARLVKTNALTTRPEDGDRKAKGTTQPPLLELQPASAIPQVQAPQFAPKRNSPNKEPRLKRAQLTRQNLAQFNNNMAGVAGSKEPGTPSLSTETKTSLTKTSTSWPAFARMSRTNGILPPVESEPPANLEKLRERCVQSRRSPSPTRSEFESYQDAVSMATNEHTLLLELSSELLKKHRTRGFIRASDQLCTAFPKNVGFNNGLRTLKPDFMEGLVVDQFRPFPVDQYIEGAVMHDNEYPVALPHLAGEWKATGRNLDDARIQTAYDGASLVYARNQALAYLKQEELSNSAEVITFVADGSSLTLYAHYASKGEDGTVKYHQYLIDQTYLNSYTRFKDGRKQLRNAQEYAKEQCYLLRDQLKEQWAKNNASPDLVENPSESPLLTPSTESPLTPSDPSVTYQAQNQKALPSKINPRVYKRGGVRRSKRKNAGLSSKKKKQISDP